MTLSRITRMAAAGLFAVLIAGGCGDPATPQAAGTNQPEIATLTTETPAAPATSGPADSERPRERIDMTDGEREALYEAYTACLHEHGVYNSKEVAMNGSGKVSTEEETRAGEAACLSKNPLPAWEMDRTNPDAVDFARKVVDCLKAKGVKYVEVSNSPDSDTVGVAAGGDQNDEESITKTMELLSVCEREVFAAGK